MKIKTSVTGETVIIRKGNKQVLLNLRDFCFVKLFLRFFVLQFSFLGEEKNKALKGIFKGASPEQLGSVDN